MKLETCDHDVSKDHVVHMTINKSDGDSAVVHCLECIKDCDMAKCGQDSKDA